MSHSPRIFVLAFFAALQCACATPPPPAAAPALVDNFPVNHQESAVAELRRLFGKCSEEDLARLRQSPCLSIALRAAWVSTPLTIIVDEEKRRAAAADPRDLHLFLAAIDPHVAQNPPPKLARFDPEPFRAFLAEVRRITGFEPPPNFRARMLSVMPVDNSHILFAEAPANSRWQAIRDSSHLKILDDRGTVRATIPLAAFTSPEEFPAGEQVSGIRAGALCYIARAQDWPYTLYAVSGKEIVWRQRVWGVSLRAGTGIHLPHPIELVETSDAIYVFGMPGSLAYIEAFRKADGACLARFATHLWCF